MKKKILVCDGLAPEGIEVLKAAGAFDLTMLDEPSHEELKRAITDAHGLIVRSHSKVSADVIDAAPSLQVIARAGTGLDNIDIDRATEKGIAVMNTPVGNTTSAAEHAIALLFSLARKIPMADADMKARRWEKNLFQGVELRGKTIAVIGLGRIGREVAARCRALSMRVVGYDPFIATQSSPGLEVEMLPLEEIWRQADFITVHTPLTGETKDLVNRDVIRRMKPDVRLINCARGGIYNEQDLFDALKNKRVAGAAIDVFTEEPPEHLPPFHELDNIVLTPHLGASTQEAQVSVAVEAAQIVAEYLTTGIARNSVNVPPTDQSEFEFLKPYINLAEKMGRLQGSLTGGRVSEVIIHYSGDFRNFNLAPVTASYIRGLLAPFTELNINFVNAPLIARQRGIKIITGEDPVSHDYSHLINIRAAGNGSGNEAWGTVLGKQPWIVKMNDYLIDFIPSGRMLVMHNNDVPNVVGTIGNFLGERKINIANLHLARTKRGGKALVIIEIDDDLDSSVIEKMRALPEILDLKYIVV